MERALDHAGDADGDDQMQSFVDGVSAVHDKMLDILAKEGVEPIDPAGQAFEPLSHQAVGRVEDKDAYDETVAQVYQKGYKMGEKVIRTAMVTVTFGGPSAPPRSLRPRATPRTPMPAISNVLSAPGPRDLGAIFERGLVQRPWQARGTTTTFWA